jgi:hypothetical protein
VGKFKFTEMKKLLIIPLITASIGFTQFANAQGNGNAFGIANNNGNGNGNSTTVTLQPDAANGKDAHLSSRNHTTNYATLPYMGARAWTYSGAPNQARGLIDFDLSSLPNNVTITDAKLTLVPYINGATNPMTGENAITISRVTQTWDEQSVTWDTQPTTDNSFQVNLPSSNNANNYEFIDVTALINDRKNNPTQNFGMMIQLVTEQHYRAAAFASSDNADVTLHPKLEITYSNGQGNGPLNSPQGTDYLGIVGPQTICWVDDLPSNRYDLELPPGKSHSGMDVIGATWSFSNSNWNSYIYPNQGNYFTIYPKLSTVYGGWLSVVIMRSDSSTYSFGMQVDFVRPNVPTNLHTVHSPICSSDNNIMFEVNPIGTASGYNWEIIDPSGLARIHDGNGPQVTSKLVLGGSNSQIYVNLNGSTNQHIELKVRARYPNSSGNYCGSSTPVSTIIDVEKLPVDITFLDLLSGSFCSGDVVDLHTYHSITHDTYHWSTNVVGVSVIPNGSDCQLTIPNNLTTIDVSVQVENVCGQFSNASTGNTYTETFNIISIPGGHIPDIDNLPTNYCGGNENNFSLTNGIPGVEYCWRLINVVSIANSLPTTYQWECGLNKFTYSPDFGEVDGVFPPPGEILSYDIEVKAKDCSGSNPSIIEQELNVQYNCNGSSGKLASSENKEKTTKSAFISIHPNPSSSGFFNLNITGFDEIKTITVVNIYGAIVYQSSMTSDRSTIDLSALSNGIYFVQVTDGAHQKIEKIIFE